MSELSDNLQNATREALDAINELNVVVREKMERIAYLEQQLKGEREKVRVKDSALRAAIDELESIIECIEGRYAVGEPQTSSTKSLILSLQMSVAKP